MEQKSMKARCTHGNGGKDLEYGKIYKVYFEDDEPYYRVYDEWGYVGLFFKSRFELMNE